MRPAARLLTLACLAAVGSCRNPVDLESANIKGTIVVVRPADHMLGVLSDNQYLVARPPGAYDYDVAVNGKIFLETAVGYREISLDQVSTGRRVLIWNNGNVADSYPAQTGADRVIVRAPE